ncbi:MAG: hypothetical protein R3C53_00285 [Pirellulaceae bacterium]
MRAVLLWVLVFTFLSNDLAKAQQVNGDTYDLNSWQATWMGWDLYRQSRSIYADSLTPNATSTVEVIQILDVGSVPVADVSVQSGPNGAVVVGWTAYKSGLSTPVIVNQSTGTVVFWSPTPSYDGQTILAEFVEFTSGDLQITQTINDPYYGPMTQTWTGNQVLLGRVIRRDRWWVDDPNDSLNPLPPLPGQ